jgi:hypothetical protein
MAGAFDRAHMKEDVLAAAFRLNEAKPLGGVVPFDHASRHLSSSSSVLSNATILSTHLRAPRRSVNPQRAYWIARSDEIAREPRYMRNRDLKHYPRQTS